MNEINKSTNAEPGWLIYDNFYKKHGIVLRHIVGYIYECYWFIDKIKQGANLSMTYESHRGAFSEITHHRQYKTTMLKSLWDKE